jgi:nitroreductase
MDLAEALRTTGAVRQFTPDPVPQETVVRLLDLARFAPSGGNRQAWRVVLLTDPALRRGLRDIYLKGWYQYLAMGAAGLVPWAPLTDREAEERALAASPAMAEAAAAGPGGFAEHLDQVPVLLVLLADLRALAAVDRDLKRYTMVGGASIYPFAWSILLAARSLGLAGVMTSVAIRYEDEVRTLLEMPDHLAVAGVLALGHPVHQPTKLRRAPVSHFATLDRFDGPALADPAPADPAPGAG